MLTPATAYTPVPPPAARAPAVVVRRSRRVDQHRAFLHRELRQGGFFHRYIAKEKARQRREIRAVARVYHDLRPKSWRSLPAGARELECELQFALPARLYWRLRQMDPQFFEDPQNLRNLRRDNPELCIWG